ncbi:MAG: CBS domain-containing protein [Nitrospiraceae bacterium]|nr:CBS domain-containing protein [Nitrospiraceae bacterium]
MTGPSGPRVSEYMHRQLETLSEETTAAVAAARMRDQRIGSLLVESLNRPQRDCRITGIVTETDLIVKVMAKGLDASTTTLGQIMSSPLLTIAADRPMLDSGHLMDQRHVRHLAVTEGNDIVGIVSVRDLVRHFMQADSGPVQALNDVYRPLSILMRTDIATIDTRDSLASAIEVMAARKIGSVFVREAGELVGILTETDIVRRAMAEKNDPKTVTVGSLLTYPLLDIDVNRSIRDACEVMTKQQVRHLAVTDKQKIVGVISIRDLVKMAAARDRPEFLRRS